MQQIKTDIQGTPASNHTYLTTEQLASKIQYEARTIRNVLKDSVLLEGIHYIRPFGRRKILFIWEKVEETMMALSFDPDAMPMGSGE